MFKTGELTRQVLEAILSKPTAVVASSRLLPLKKPFELLHSPTKASDIASYLFRTVQQQQQQQQQGISEIIESEITRFFDPTIQYRDFNYDDLRKGDDAITQFVNDFNFPGVDFVMERHDDGVSSTCFTWRVGLNDDGGGVDADKAWIRGISLYEINDETKLVNYVRDIPESAIKPPPLGKIARRWRPGLGCFDPAPLGSRLGGK